MENNQQTEVPDFKVQRSGFIFDELASSVHTPANFES
jgi:hypothetical protein